MTNPIGVHALVWTGQWDEESARYAISSSKEAGFDLIEVPILDPYAIDTEMTRRLLEEYELQAACSMGLPAHADVSSEDAEVVAAGQRMLRRAAEVSEEMGSRHLCGVLYSQLTKYPGPVTRRSRENVVASIAALDEAASSRDVSVSLEVVNRYETNVVNTAAEMLTLLDETGTSVDVHLDTYHMNIEENGFVEPVQQTGSRLGYVHVGESHRGYLGTGTIDFDTFLEALRTGSYEGPITFESFSSAVVHPDLSNNLAVWRNLWSDGADLARHAYAFMSERLRPSG